MNERVPVRMAVLGTGAIAQIVHLPVLTGLDGVGVTAVADVDEAKARAIAGRFQIPHVFESDEEVFDSDDVDAVVICTPSYLHERQTIAALEAGKHVLVERPLALDAQGCEAVLKAAEQAGRVVMVALNNRYRQDVLGVRAFVQGGELGHLFYMKGGWFNRKTRVLRPTWRHRRETAGGGALMDLGVQVLDLCLWMLDYPEVDRLVAHVHPGENMEVEDSASVLLRTKPGQVVSVEVTWSLLAERDRHYLRMLGSHGSASVAPLVVHKEVEAGLLDVTPQIAPDKENPYTASYRHELRHFADAIRGAREAHLPTEQVELMRLIELAYASAEKGRELKA